MEAVTEGRSKKGISGTTVKLIAIAAMLIDHLAAIFVDSYIRYNVPLELSQAEGTEFIRNDPKLMGFSILMGVMRLIGRFGFPLFAFLLVEGFEHTRSVKKYALNLFIFALISEIPFNLGFSSRVFDPYYQNVFFTLLLGLICISAARYLGEDRKRDVRLKPLFYLSAFLAGAGSAYILFVTSWPGMIAYSIIVGKDGKVLLLIMASAGLISLLLFLPAASKWDSAKRNAFTGIVLPFFITGAVAELLMTDYSAGGVLTILVIYLLRRRRMLSFAMGCLVLFLMNPSEITAFLMLIPVGLYNGSRGMKLNKYFFYAFYPVHLGLIYLLALALGYVGFALK